MGTRAFQRRLLLCRQRLGSRGRTRPYSVVGCTLLWAASLRRHQKTVLWRYVSQRHSIGLST